MEYVTGTMTYPGIPEESLRVLFIAKVDSQNVTADRQNMKLTRHPSNCCVTSCKLPNKFYSHFLHSLTHLETMTYKSTREIADI